MIPNQLNKKSPWEKDVKRLLLECQCHGFHYLDFEQWGGKDEDYEIQMCFIDRPTSWLGMIRDMWKHREMYVNDVVLSRKDAEAMIKILREMLKANKSHNKKK